MAEQKTVVVYGGERYELAKGEVESTSAGWMTLDLKGGGTVSILFSPGVPVAIIRTSEDDGGAGADSFG